MISNRFYFTGYSLRDIKYSHAGMNMTLILLYIPADEYYWVIIICNCKTGSNTVLNKYHGHYPSINYWMRWGSQKVFDMSV